jgi:tryptophanyl-tRNA synthetase
MNGKMFPMNNGAKERVLSGIQPTHNSFHLGNYLGAIKQWVDLQNTNDAFYCVVDLHALTVETKPEDFRKRTLASVAQLIALGLDPQKCTLFIQSHVPAHNQLSWVLECLTGFGEASRMTQFKDKSQKAGSDRTVVGLFTYPILQAADILLYRADKVPVGEDQRQHIELTRDLGQRFNSKFGDTFTIPEGYILKAGAKISDLQDPTAKMSKSSASASGVIELMDSPEINVKKIKSAVTDTGREVLFDEKEKPGVSNLLTIYGALTGKTIEQSQDDFAGKGYGDFKAGVAEVVVGYLNPVRERANELLQDETHLKNLLKVGAEKAEAVASQTLSDVYGAMGLIPRG